MTKHTPGPWMATPTSGTYGHVSSSPVGGGDIATAWGVVGDGHADAHLIAAAPEMYEALKMVMLHGRIDDSEERMNIVGAAIAKAEGK